jgi:hypothetical protein
MGLDVRLPLGLLFLAIGMLLSGFGLATKGSDIYARSMEVNLNLIWGSILMTLGLMAAWIGRKPKVGPKPGSHSGSARSNCPKPEFPLPGFLNL